MLHNAIIAIHSGFSYITFGDCTNDICISSYAFPYCLAHLILSYGTLYVFIYNDTGFSSQKTCFMHHVFVCAYVTYVCVEEGEGMPVCRWEIETCKLLKYEFFFIEMFFNSQIYEIRFTKKLESQHLIS